MRFSLEQLEPFKQEVGAPFGHSDEEVKPNGGITLTEAKTMYALVRYFNIRRVLETGTHMGNSTWYIAEALKRNHNHNSHSVPGTYLTTVDVNQRQGRHTQENPHVLAVQSDALGWMRANDLSIYDYYNHDDLHDKGHIEKEMELIHPHMPKLITVHDSRTESWPFWEMVLNTPGYMIEYDRHEITSGLGMGILIRH